ncbi:MAG: NAD-dependent epimerase/dehydratase family protein, partial [Gemmobacter sp.]
MAEPVILTGATGFVGRAVLAQLVAQGIPVHAISRKDGPAQEGVTWHRADLLTPEGRAAVAGLAPRLIHCAWEVEHGAFWASPANALWQAASVDLARRFRATGGQRLLALGTCAEYDATAPGPWDENRPIAPATPYGQAKAALHGQLADLCGGRLIWARLFHLYGPGEDRRRLIPFLIDRLRSGQPAEVRAAGLVRDYASTAHVARCLVALLQAGAPGAFDIGSGTPRPLGDLARVIALAVGATSGLRLGNTPGPNDPAVMAPDLRKLWAATGLAPEDTDAALHQFARSA